MEQIIRRLILKRKILVLLLVVLISLSSVGFNVKAELLENGQTVVALGGPIDPEPWPLGGPIDPEPWPL